MILATALAVTMLAAPSEPEFAELAVLLDISGSTLVTQKALRGYAIERATNLLDHYGKGRFRLAFVTYSYGAAQANVKDFTADPQKMEQFLVDRIRSTGGKEEATDVALKALQSLNWSYGKKVKRMLMVMGNEMPKQGITTIQAVADLAAKGKVSINTVFTPFDVEAGSPQPWEEWAAKGNGEFRLFNESDVVTYTNVYDTYFQQVLLDEDSRQKAEYLNNLMNKRGRGGK